jgi:ATPase subunit of ABC transporter with duplicated ATPase domains
LSFVSVLVLCFQQLDTAALTASADLELDGVTLAVAQQGTHLNGVQTVARESAEGRVKLAEELEKVTQVRAVGRKALDELYAEHDAKMKKLQERLEGIEAQAKAKQQLSILSKQKMVRRSVASMQSGASIRQ